MLKRFTAAAVLLCTLLTLAPAVFAETADSATDISASTAVYSDGFDHVGFLTDRNTTTYHSAAGKCSITLMNERGMASLYLMFDQEYGEYQIENAENGKIITAGQEGYLHEYIDLVELFRGPITSVTLHFNRGKVRLSEIQVFTEGAVPDHVQIWQPPLEDRTDILLLSTHGDDDQLFFAGLLPRYAGQEKAGVQVAYLTDHRNLTSERTHEILNGLWATGCTVYPVMADFPDFRIDSLKGTYQEFERQGYDEDELLGYVVELLRRFNPQVVVGHDIDGEYGHGMHMVYTDCLIKALDVSNDETAFPELAQTYGLWDVPKTYLHLYQKNTIELDYDQPLSSFDGMTAFEVSQKLGYPCHKSQQATWFTDWINGSDGEITKATQINRYNPCRFGLYRSTIGEDVKRNDFLENIITYRDQERIEQERLEAERQEKEKEEQERLEKEREELDRLEAERTEKRRQEAERLAKEQQEREQLQLKKQKEQKIIAAIVFGGVILLCAVLLWGYIAVKRKIRSKRKQHSEDGCKENLENA